MDSELIKKLYETVLAKRNVGLTDLQRKKFLSACEKTIAENSNLNFEHWTTAANIYLNFVLDFPQLDLGPIVEPLKEQLKV